MDLNDLSKRGVRRVPEQPSLAQAVRARKRVLLLGLPTPQVQVLAVQEH